MWLTDRTILNQSWQHTEYRQQAERERVRRQAIGSAALLPRPCCRLLSRLGHRLAVAGTRLELRYGAF